MMEDDQPWPLRISNYYSPKLRRLIKQVGVNFKHSKDRHLLFERIWHPLQIGVQGQDLSKKGLGYQDIQVYNYHMVLTVDTSNRKDEDLTEDVPIDHPGKDIKLKDAPAELEDGGQTIIYELVKINLGSEDDRKPTFLSA